jgi:WS/DGAT/MGAT family acyltransferase
VATLVEGLEGGRSTYLLQAHHVLMDGMAVTQLFKRVMSPQRDTTPDKPLGPDEDFETLGPLDVTGRELARQASSAPRLLGSMLRTARKAVTDPAGAARYTASLAHVLAPPPANRSQVLRGGHRRVWRFGTLECSLADLKAAGKAAGGTVNDTFVCVLLGGLRGYCAAMGEDLPDIPISMPVSMRKLDDAMGGNKFAGAFFSVPASIADPVERIQEMRRRVEEVRGEPALDFLGNITPILNRTPSGLAAALLGGINARSVLTTSSWPGLTEELYIAGAKFERMFVFAPLPGTVLTGAMCTHAGTCCIAINVDGEVITDPPLLWDCMQASLDEILALAR